MSYRKVMIKNSIKEIENILEDILDKRNNTKDEAKLNKYRDQIIGLDQALYELGKLVR